MTVADRLRQTFVQTKSISVQLEQFALDTENKQAEQLYRVLAKKSADVASVLQTRILALEQEEEQYKS